MDQRYRDLIHLVHAPELSKIFFLKQLKNFMYPSNRTGVLHPAPTLKRIAGHAWGCSATCYKLTNTYDTIVGVTCASFSDYGVQHWSNYSVLHASRDEFAFFLIMK